MHRLRSIVAAKSHADAPFHSCNVRHSSVCSAVDVQDLDRLATTATERDISKGQVFIDEGQPATAFFNITTGTAKLFKLLPDGRQQITGFATTGHFLGLAVSNTYAFSAEAIEPMRLCWFARPRLREVLEDFPLLKQCLLQTACNELVTAQEQMPLLGHKTTPERVASFLVAQSHDAVSCRNPVDYIAVPMTRTDVADYLGLTIETVSRVLSRFRADKRIAMPSNHEISILDRGWLQSLATGLN